VTEASTSTSTNSEKDIPMNVRHKIAEDVLNKNLIMRYSHRNYFPRCVESLSREKYPLPLPFLHRLCLLVFRCRCLKYKIHFQHDTNSEKDINKILLVLFPFIS